MSDKRSSTRYQRSELPSELHNVSIKCPDGRLYPSRMVDLSAVGMRIAVQPGHCLESELPPKGEPLGIEFPLLGIELAGTCVHSETNPDDRVVIGVFVSNHFSRKKLEELLKTSLP